ncbi:MAG: hypothetical protein ABJB66_21055 [Gemmatimonadaceae bacterium]
MRTIQARRYVAAALLLSVVAVTATAQRLLADVTGKWTMSVTTPNGATESIATFKQTGDTLSGTVESEMMGSAKVTGMVKGDTVRFAFTIDIQGQQIPLTAGALLKGDSMEGTVSAAGMGDFPMTMKKQK